ncbi:hypothetical protein, partial [Staphylococcus epidermidis]|uniref:hypothetical protein n=1 Tax=Staphylococcus epidermidis TaxID=1282 RepID=UPI00301CB9EE
IGSGSYLLVRSNSSSEIEKPEHIKNNIVANDSAPIIQHSENEVKITHTEQISKETTIADKKTDNQNHTINKSITATSPGIDNDQELAPKVSPFKSENTTSTTTESKNDFVTPPANKCDGVVISAQLLVQEPCNGTSNG